jgi:hypothetical protein
MLFKFFCHKCECIFYVEDEERSVVSYCPICKNTDIEYNKSK